MSFTLDMSKAAHRDVQQVLSHALEQFGELQHRRYKLLIRDAIRHLVFHPDQRPAKPLTEIAPNVWRLHLAQKGARARHFFLYSISGDTVRGQRLLHDAMGLKRHLPDDLSSAE